MKIINNIRFEVFWWNQDPFLKPVPKILIRSYVLELYNYLN